MPTMSSGKVARLPSAAGICSAQGPGLGKKVPSPTPATQTFTSGVAADRIAEGDGPGMLVRHHAVNKTQQ